MFKTLKAKRFIKKCVEAREQEVAGYEFNIRNYEAARDLISKDADLADRQFEFYIQLKSLLASELIQQERAKIMLDVLLQRQKGAV